MRKRANSEGTIRQRGDGRWEALITLSGGHRRSFYGKTQQGGLEEDAGRETGGSGRITGGL